MLHSCCCTMFMLEKWFFCFQNMLRVWPNFFSPNTKSIFKIPIKSLLTSNKNLGWPILSFSLFFSISSSPSIWRPCILHANPFSSYLIIWMNLNWVEVHTFIYPNITSQNSSLFPLMDLWWAHTLKFSPHYWTSPIQPLHLPVTWKGHNSPLYSCPPLVQHLIPFHHAETSSSSFSSFSIPDYLSSLHVEKTCSHASSLPFSSKHISPLIVRFKRSACNGSLSLCLFSLAQSLSLIQRNTATWNPLVP